MYTLWTSEVHNGPIAVSTHAKWMSVYVHDGQGEEYLKKIARMPEGLLGVLVTKPTGEVLKLAFLAKVSTCDNHTPAHTLLSCQCDVFVSRSPAHTPLRITWTSGR